MTILGNYSFEEHSVEVAHNNAVRLLNERKQSVWGKEISKLVLTEPQYEWMSERLKNAVSEIQERYK